MQQTGRTEEGSVKRCASTTTNEAGPRVVEHKYAITHHASRRVIPAQRTTNSLMEVIFTCERKGKANECRALRSNSHKRHQTMTPMHHRSTAHIKNRAKKRSLVSLRKSYTAASIPCA
jgi:hypothetical protein